MRTPVSSASTSARARASPRAGTAHGPANVPRAESGHGPRGWRPIPPLPTGTVTFLFTDIEESTPLIQHLGDAQYARVLADHRRLLRVAFEAGQGREIETQGDGFLVAFQSARDALLTALNAQRAIAAHPWPDAVDLRVRMGLHTGEPIATGGAYVGLDVHRAARICEAGWGGQILLSHTTRDLVDLDLPADAGLRDLGAHRLKGLHRPEHVFQLLHPALAADFPTLRTLDSLPNNLPRQLTSFVGREREMANVKQVLSRDRLVTLAGSGGCGKTRLAIEIATDLVDAYRDGVWLVELATLSDPGLVPQRVASVMRVREQPGRPLHVTLSEHLKPKHLLIILDNCEHLVRACAQLAELVLRACPDVHILTTSRERLGVGGEVTYRVPSLSLPNLDRVPPFEALTQSEAVRLFVDRATSVMPRFQLTRDNAPLVAHICQRLDGIPLAIELAAARVKVLALDQIALRLNDRFRLLVGGSRTAPTRQQTLRAVMDWSYVLLPEKERVLLGRLSVFAGGWRLEAAESICAGGSIENEGILDLLSELVDKSLVIVDEQAGEIRYRLLETVRQYGQERLLESGQDAPVRQRHRDWFLGLAERAEVELRGAAQSTWLKCLEVEHDNLRAALEWSQAEAGTGEAGLRLAAAMGRFWWMRGYLTEARGWLEGVLKQRGDATSASRARALLEAGRLAWAQSDYTAAGTFLEQSLALSRGFGDRPGIADALNMLGLVAWVQSEYSIAHARYQEGLVLSRDLDDRRRVATLLNNLGRVSMAQGDHAAADSFHRQSLEIYQTMGDIHGIAISLHNLGLTAAAQDRDEEARALFEESLRIRQELGDRHNVVYSLNSLGLVAYRQGRFQQAAELSEESLALSRELGNQEGIANALVNLARLAQHRDNLERAAALGRESLVLRRALGDRRGIAEGLDILAGLASAQGQKERAGRLFGAAAALRDAIGAPIPPADRAEHDRDVASVLSELGEKGPATLLEGRRMQAEQAIAFAIADKA
ncbi:MAG: ATP-binding protein [Armatimonadota bacterium]